MPKTSAKAAVAKLKEKGADSADETQVEKPNVPDPTNFIGEVVRVTGWFAWRELVYEGRLVEVRPPLPSGKGGGIILHDMINQVERTEWTWKPEHEWDESAKQQLTQSRKEPKYGYHHTTPFVPQKGDLRCGFYKPVAFVPVTYAMPLRALRNIVSLFDLEDVTLDEEGGA